MRTADKFWYKSFILSGSLYLYYSPNHILSSNNQLQLSPRSTLTTKMTTTARQNYSQEVEDGINKQINNELNASYKYLAMANYFGRVEVALPGSAAFFADQSKEETEHAQKLIDYQNSRGGKVRLHGIPAPETQEWTGLHAAFVDALNLEKSNNTAIIRLHQLAEAKKDADLTNFLEEHYLRVQVEEIEMMARHCNTLARMGQGLGEHLFDQELVKFTEENRAKNKE